MKAVQVLTAMLGISVVCANAELIPARQRFIVPPGDVAKTIVTTFAARGVQVVPEQVTLPMSVVATEEHPLLEVVGVDDIGHIGATDLSQRSAGIRLKCRSAGACLPFYAVVSWQEGASQASTLSSNSGKTAKTANERSMPLIKRGASLTLLMESDHARIQIAVISLGSAAFGQQIRVTTPDHKHIYTAEALDANTVKGTF